MLRFSDERALPDLDSNIKCGNSLISWDIIDEKPDLTKEELQRINPFDWQREFLEVFERGGFDIVIGNPPYIRIQTMKDWAPLEVDLYKQKYAAASKGNYDIYVIFVEKGLNLLNEKGRLGFIMPHKFFNAQYGKPLRTLLSINRYLSEIVHFGYQQVFAGATTYTCLLFLSKIGSEKFRFIKVDDINDWRTSGRAQEGEICAYTAEQGDWNFSVGTNIKLIEKLDKFATRLGDLAHIFVGTQTSAEDVFVISQCRFGNSHTVGFSKALNKEVRVESAITKPFLRGKQIRRYELTRVNIRLICPYKINENSFRLLTPIEMRQNYPMTMEYLESAKESLTMRENGRFSKDNWYAFGYPKSMTLFQKPKIVVPDYNNSASFAFDDQGYFYKTGYGILLEHELLSPFYILGLLNSPLLFQYLRSISTSLRGGYIRFWTQYLEKIPIRTIDFSDPHDIASHDRMVSLVQTMLDLHKQLVEPKGGHERTLLQRQIEATDRQIDTLVYELYGLTEEEIKIVEGS